MAGVRHHILPRFLLKGFTRKVNVKELLMVYRRSGTPFQASTGDVAVEKRFYGGDSKLSVDDQITAIEGDFAVLLNELRTRNSDQPISDLRVADFVTHLSSRTKHLRDSFFDSSSVLITILTGYLSDPENFRSWILDYLKRHPEVIQQARESALDKLNLNREQKAVMRHRLQVASRPESVVAQMDKDITQYAWMFGAVAPLVIQQLPSAIKTGHIKALAKSLIPEPRAEIYRKLNWFLIKTSVPLILGDVGCLFEVTGKKRFVSTTGSDDDVRNVFLPISHDTLLFGTALSSVPKMDVRSINENFARSSRDFFVCREPSDDMEDLKSAIGQNAEILTLEEIQQLVREVILES